MANEIVNNADSRRNFGHVLPGALSWAVIVLAVLGSLLFPRVWLAIATIFMAYVVFRLVVTASFMAWGQHRIHQAEKTDFTLGEDEVGPFGFAPSDLRHVVIIPNYKEPAEILRRTLEGLAAQHRAPERLIVVLGMEEREQGALEKGLALTAEFEGRFLHTLVTVHPGNIAGEEPGKSSNETWAARKARAELDVIGVPIELTTITSCDADSVLHPKYFSAVAGSFAADELRFRTFWQAPIFFYNNLWQVPAPVRFTTSLQHATQLSELAMPFYNALPISTYTLSMQTAEQCGWWDVSVIPEDWHSWLNCLFEMGDDIQTVPVFLPTMGDATDGETLMDAVRNRFEQLKRHSWGAEDVGFIYGQLTQRKHTWRQATVFRFAQVLHDHVMRVIGWVFLMSVYALSAYYTQLHWYDLGWHASVAQNLAVLRFMMTIGGSVMIGSIVVELWRCPPPDSVSKLKTAVELMLMWFLLPVIGFYLGMAPALSAQTRLLLGIPLGYKVTPKRFTAPEPQKAG